MPTRKAPNAIDSPRLLVSQAAVSETNNTVNVNSSPERRSAMTRKNGRKHRSPCEIDKRKGQGRFGEHRDNRHPQRLRVGSESQHRDDDDEGRGGDVLKHGHRQPQPAVPALVLPLLLQLPADDGARRLGEYRADDEGRRSGHPGQPGNHSDDGGRKENLRRAEPEHQVPQRVDLRQREVQPDSEQQKDDAVLGQQAQLLALDGRTGRVGTKEHANQQVAQHRRGPQAMEQGDDRHRRAQQEQQLNQRLLEHGKLQQGRDQNPDSPDEPPHGRRWGKNTSVRLPNCCGTPIQYGGHPAIGPPSFGRSAAEMSVVPGSPYPPQVASPWLANDRFLARETYCRARPKSLGSRVTFKSTLGVEDFGISANRSSVGGGDPDRSHSGFLCKAPVDGMRAPFGSCRTQPIRLRG